MTDPRKAPRVDLYGRVRGILESARVSLARTVNTTQVVANWLIGREIVEDEQSGRRRAGYGAKVLAELSEKVPEGVPLRFDRVEITKDKLHLQGTTEAAENVDKLVTALRASRCFGDARSGGARRRGAEGKFEFSADASLTCVEGAAEAGRKP